MDYVHDPEMQYQKFENTSGDSNITVVVFGKLYGCRSDHRNWTEIVQKAEAYDTSVVDLFKPADTIATKFAELTDRISVNNGRILWDGDEIHNSLTEKILSLMDERVEDWRVFVNFMEKLYTNPDQRSREQAFDYLMRNHHTITPEGNFLAYKGVLNDGKGGYKSSSSGEAIVNDETCVGQIPNPIGAVVRMPRALVSNDPNAACHVGLHVATWGFAKRFAVTVLEVEINPRDIVSVPYNADKLRVCRYKVIGEVTEPTKAVYQKAVETPVVETPTVLVTEDDVHYDPTGVTPLRHEDEVEIVEPDVLDLLSETIFEDCKIVDVTTSYPTQSEFDAMKGRAKRRRRNFEKYATKHGLWTFTGGDVNNRKDWTR